MKKTVFIHGLFGHVSDFNSISEPDDILINLEDHDHEFLSFQSVAESIKNQIDLLTKNPCNLVGYSMGGRLAMQLKVLYPEKFDRCAFIGSRLNMDFDFFHKRILWQAEMELSLAFLPLKEFFKIWYSQELFNSFKWTDFQDRRLKLNKHFHQKCLNQLNLFFQQDFRNLLLPYQSKLLFIHGEQDLVYKKYYQRISKKGYIIQEIKSSSHPTILEQPETTKQTIKTFFDYAI